MQRLFMCRLCQTINFLWHSTHFVWYVFINCGLVIWSAIKVFYNKSGNMSKKCTFKTKLTMHIHFKQLAQKMKDLWAVSTSWHTWWELIGVCSVQDIQHTVLLRRRVIFRKLIIIGHDSRMIRGDKTNSGLATNDITFGREALDDKWWHGDFESGKRVTKQLKSRQTACNTGAYFGTFAVAGWSPTHAN